jgi:hypothetical protein
MGNPEPVGVSVFLDCEDHVRPRVRHALDSLGLALGVRFEEGPADGSGACLVYSPQVQRREGKSGAVLLRHDPGAWAAIAACDADQFMRSPAGPSGDAVDASNNFDLLASVFLLLSGALERDAEGTRRLYRHSAFERLGIPSDIVDRHASWLQQRLVAAGAIPDADDRLPAGPWAGHRYAVALTHDVDYLPVGRLDNAKVALKSAARHLFKQRSAAEAAEALGAYLKAALRGEDAFGCVPAIIAEEQRRGVKSSFQVAVGHRHAMDVNYRIEDDRIRDYLSVIREQGFELCLHGSYRSTEQPGWYEEEVELLARRLGRPIGSRQHFLSFDADRLFTAQERAGIQYDMSMGFPDRCGSRVGFSQPYFPYNLNEERPYDVVQIPLVLMDVTLRSYMGLRGEAAWAEIQRQLDVVRQAGGAVSVVWHPIVFGGARDPGYDRLCWRLVEYVQETGGLATDGRTINALVRERAARFGLFPKPGERGAA